MTRLPGPIEEFLKGRRIAVAGVSRGKESAANPVYRKLCDSGYDAFPVNPIARAVEGVTCYPDLAAIPGDLDGVVVATHPDVSIRIVEQAAARGVRRVWFHRTFGKGSVSPEAVEAAMSPRANPPNTATIIRAAPVISLPVERSPKATASELEPVSMNFSHREPDVG